MDVTVIGAGYVGLVTGIGLAHGGGHTVTFVETDAGRRADLVRGVLPINEPGLLDLFGVVRDQIRVTGAIEETADPPDLVLVAVATPIGEDGDPDLRQVESVASTLVAWPDLDVCVRSTLPPGTSVRLPALFGRTDGRHISTNPEFLAQGSALADFQRPARVVIGRYPETTADHLSRVRSLFSRPGTPSLEMSVQAAELVKNVANGFLALKLSFVNEVASLAEEYGVDVEEILEGIGLDPRIGSIYMRPGLGFGGSCLPKELQVLAVAGRRQGLAMHIARAASQVNAEQQDRFARRVLSELGESSQHVALLGLSFKRNTDDLRGSPSLTIARRLIQAGHLVTAHDPAVPPDRAAAAVPGLDVAPAPEDALRDADALVIGTDWPVYADLALDRVAALMRGRLVFDGRNLLDRRAVARAGLAYRGIGRRSTSAVGDPSLVQEPAAGATSATRSS